MKLHLYNSLTRKKEVFTPQNPKHIRMYVCGITPYDTTHLGHAFTYTVFDVLKRYLEYKGSSVTYVQNVTDIDDDILLRSKKEKKDWQALGTFWTNKFLGDLKDLGIVMPTHYVKATDSIPMMLKIIADLLQKKFAYEVNGTIFFAIKSFPRYGELSRYSEEQMLFLARDRGVDLTDKRKKHPLDFVLWQKSLPDEPSWDSPYGKGRPGWHIECSAMIHQYLGEQIDIHGGGRDLIYPHHESEIAQSESYTGKKPFVRTWMHTAMLLYEGEKMSKSLRNLIMVSDLLKSYSPNAVRFVFLSHHYRTPWEFSEDELQKAEMIVKKFPKEVSEEFIDKKLQQTFETLMNDDLDTPKIMQLVTDTIKTKNRQQIISLFPLIQTLGFV